MQLKNIGGFAFGPIFAAALSLAIVPITTWIFSPADVGRMNIFQITLSFALLLSALGLDQAYVREYHEVQDKEQLLWMTFAPGFLLLIFLGVSGGLVATSLAELLYADANPWLYWVTFGACIANYISRFLSLVLRMQERGWAYSFSQALPKIVQLIMLTGIILYSFERRFIHLQSIVLISLILVSAIYAWNTRQQWRVALSSNIDKMQMRKLLIFGFPLIFSGLVYWGMTAAGSIMLRAYSTLNELAIYSVAGSFAGAAAVLQSIFTVIWAPIVYKWISQEVDMTIIEGISQKVLAVTCVLITLSGSLSWIVDLLLPAPYSSVKYLLLIMLIQPLFYTLSEVTCIGIGITRRTIFSLWITLVAFFVSLGLSFVMAGYLGATGVAIANAAAFTVFLVGRSEVSARIWRSFLRRGFYGYIFGLLILVCSTTFIAKHSRFGIHALYFFLFLVSLYHFRRQWYEIGVLMKIRVRL